MAQSIIEVKVLSKQYRIGSHEPYLVLRDVLARLYKMPLAFFKSIARVSRKNTFLALNNVNFTVQAGEVVGIIGRNGAGKTTLLKILSRITYPSSGEVILRGRVASLLEVGTGFHPELTGRENIYFNGAILGMRKKEINAKFNEIVAFAEVEQFIDTPVKHYSSGMQLRLAFSVAAHLEPEILLVDEVLAVGDAQFQKKCLGKMGEVARAGRTVLFVSHNMVAIQRLCSRAILLESGKILQDGNVNDVINMYLNYGLTKAGERLWDDNDAPGDDVVRLKGVRTCDSKADVKDEFSIHESITVEIEYDVLTPHYPLNTMCYFLDETGITKFVSIDNLDSPWKNVARPVGLYRCRCYVPADFLNEGTVRITVLVTTSPYNLHAQVADVLIFKIIDDMDPRGARGNYPREWPQAVVRPRLQWDVEHINS